MKNNSRMDMTKGPIAKQLIIFSIPIILSSILQQLYTTADQIIVGKFAQNGDTALAAVGATSNVTNLLLNLFIGLSVGATVTCAKFIGAKDKERTSRTVHTAVGLSIVSGLFISLVGIVFARMIMIAMSTPADVIDHSVLYMQIRFAGVPFSLIYNFGAGLMRASGEAKKPLYILGVTGLINVMLNLVFVIYFGMAEAGVALATSIANVLNSICIIYCLTHRSDDMKLYLKKIRFYKDEFLNILKVGIPSGLNAILFNLANVVLQSSVNGFGKIYMAASTSASSLGNYLSLVCSAFGTSTLSFVGQNYGAKNYKRIRKVTLVANMMGIAVVAILAVIITLNGRFFLGLFTNEQQVIDAGIGKVFILCYGYIIYLPSAVFSSTLRGIEKSNLPLAINIASTLGVRLLWIWFIFPLHKTFNFLLLAYPLSWGSASLALMITYLVQRSKFPKEDSTSN